VREALQHVPLPILGLDEEQVVAFANLAAQDLFRQDGMLLGSSAALFMPTLLEALDQAGEGPGCTVRLHGTGFEVAAHSMGKGTRSRGRLIIFTPVPAVLTDEELQ
jgi:PAS domain-containing protein